MRDEKKSFKHESLYDSDSIQELIKALNKGLAKGKLSFSDEDDELVLHPEGLLNLKLTASQEENQNRLTLRISWQNESDKKKSRKPLTIK